jgi:hypothetical protein
VSFDAGHVYNLCPNSLDKGIAAWKIGKWRRNRIRARAPSSNVGEHVKTADVVHVSLHKTETTLSEKEAAIIEPYKWRPLSRPPTAHSASKSVKKGTKRFFGGIGGKKPAPIAMEATSPPPAYVESALSPPIIIVEDTGKGRSSTGLKITPPSPSSPLPSPARIQSMGPDSPLYKTALATAKLNAQRASQAAKPLPRLMAVVCTFTPNLTDELGVSVGEPLLLIEEYEDEWCLVQRVGKADAERGVIPRFCLQEAPILPNRRTSFGATRQ